MKTKRSQVSVHAGSMADIAFLLLIFFLVATTISNDEGIARKLPPYETSGKAKHEAQNVLTILINHKQEIFLKDAVITPDALRTAIKYFIDNNGSGTCTYCKGARDANASESPQKAVISVQTDREVAYRTYVTVQNEISGAYTELREIYAREMFEISLDMLTKEQMRKTLEAYPQLISENALE
ncbi:biopolymer transporter ExbD [Ascidiimonas aurantiaca]|uniref:ExbD/TolR family protein n=1 Tax=Ascidiimonas aurantiaca TaxID=1685432 RepID=UPI0030EBA791